MSRRKENHPLKRGPSEKSLHLEATLNSTSDGILMVEYTPDGEKITLANKRFGEIFGLDPQAVIGADDEAVREEAKKLFKDPEAFQQGVRGLYRNKAKTRVDILELVNPAPGRSGVKPRPMVIERFTGPVRNSQGKIIGRIWSFRDVTERRVLERKVRLLHDAFQHSTDAFLITDLKGVIIEVNQAFVKTFGYSYKEVIGQRTDFLRTRHTADDFYKEMWKAINEKGQWTGEIINKRKDGSEIPILLSITPIYEEGKKIGYMGVEIDITERKLLEQQMIQSEKMAGLGVLASGIAHEIGNPLTAISSLTQILQKKEKEPFITENLDLIRTHIDRITKIVRQMVDFAHPPTSLWEKVQVNDVVEEAIQLTKYDKRMKGIQVVTQFDLHLPPAKIMKDQFLQVCMNILLNGIDAMKKGGTLTVTTQKVGAYSNTPLLKIAFTDTGVGMREDTKRRVFEPFFTTKEVGKGTGLGLSVSYSIIQKHGGRIEVESKLGKGSTLTVILPLKQ